MSKRTRPISSAPPTTADFQIYYGKVTEIGPCDGEDCRPEAHTGDYCLGITVGDAWINLCPSLEKRLLQTLLAAYLTRTRPGAKVKAGYSGPLDRDPEGPFDLQDYLG
jgi:hypothetical protein